MDENKAPDGTIAKGKHVEFLANSAVRIADEINVLIGTGSTNEIDEDHGSRSGFDHVRLQRSNSTYSVLHDFDDRQSLGDVDYSRGSLGRAQPRRTLKRSESTIRALWTNRTVLFLGIVLLHSMLVYFISDYQQLGKATMKLTQFNRNNPIVLPEERNFKRKYDQIEKDVIDWHMALDRLYHDIADDIYVLGKKEFTEDSIGIKLDMDANIENASYFARFEERPSIKAFVGIFSSGDSWFTRHFISIVLMALFAHLNGNGVYLYISTTLHLATMHLILRASALNGAMDIAVGKLHDIKFKVALLQPAAYRQRGRLFAAALDPGPGLERERTRQLLCLEKIHALIDRWENRKYGIKLILPFTWREIVMDPFYLTEENFALAGALLFLVVITLRRRKWIWWIVYIVTFLFLAIIID